MTEGEASDHVGVQFHPRSLVRCGRAQGPYRGDNRKATLYGICAYNPTAGLRRHTEGCIDRRTAVASDIRPAPRRSPHSLSQGVAGGFVELLGVPALRPPDGSRIPDVLIRPQTYDLRGLPPAQPRQTSGCEVGGNVCLCRGGIKAGLDWLCRGRDDGVVR